MLKLPSTFTNHQLMMSLAIHQESKADPVPEFELEIRRRVWCVMDTWDW